MGGATTGTTGTLFSPLIWQAPTRTMNPTVSQAYIDAEMEKDPISAAAEYLAQFRAVRSSGGVAALPGRRRLGAAA